MGGAEDPKKDGGSSRERGAQGRPSPAGYQARLPLETLPWPTPPASLSQLLPSSIRVMVGLLGAGSSLCTPDQAGGREGVVQSPRRPVIPGVPKSCLPRPRSVPKLGPGSATHSQSGGPWGNTERVTHGRSQDARGERPHGWPRR